MGYSFVIVVEVSIQLRLQLGDTGRQGLVVELVFEGPLYPFDVTVQLGALGWKDEELDVVLLASLFKLGHELAPSVHLYGSGGEGSLGKAFG